MDAKQIGARIKEARVKKGITSYRALAERLTQKKRGGSAVEAVSGETVRLWEVGDRVPPWEKLEQLAEVLGESEEWFLFGIRREEQLRQERRFLEWISDEEMALLTQFRQSNKTGQGLVLDSAASMAKKFPKPLAEVRAIGGGRR